MKRSKVFTYALTAIVLVSGISFSVGTGKAYAEAEGPQVVGTEKKFNELFEELFDSHQKANYDYGYFGMLDVVEEEMSIDVAPPVPQTEPRASNAVAAEAPAGGMIMGEAADNDSGNTDYSATNTQVEGVDEADIIKTDGEYIYHLTNSTVHITQADGKGTMKMISATKIGGSTENYYPNDMYVDGDTLCIIGYSWNIPDARTKSSSHYYYSQAFTKVLVLDISDRAKPKTVRDFYVEGNLISSRKVDNTLYLIVNHNMYFYGMDKPSDLVPLFRDSAVDSKEFQPLRFSAMRYFPGQNVNSMMIVCGLDVSNPKAEASVESILGSGSTVYMSRSALYVARNDYLHGIVPTNRGVVGRWEEKTIFYKFSLKDGKAAYTAQAAADGHVLNQYSMDEHNGFFRVAMTIDQHNWQNSKNTLTIFDDKMKQTGKIEDMAPGEKIYSARFMGDKAFMVTYRTVDPLFAMDLSDPKNPKVLGELKIPGYSTYLHPYDENHLIGFGRDTEEMTTTNSKGEVVNSWATNKGLKMSLFDVSDMTNPKEVSVVSIGNEYTHSELLYNPKAWLFNKEKGFVAFPVTHYDYSSWDQDFKTSDNFNGAYVYNIDTKGIRLRGKIELKEENDSNQRYRWRHDNSIQRIIYIGDTFYSAANQGIQANNVKDLKYIGSVEY